MIEFTELRVTADGEYLIIKARVKDLPYFDNIIIEALGVNTEETYKEDAWSTNAIYYTTFEENNTSDSTDDPIVPAPKEISLTLPRGVFSADIRKHLLFISVETGGVPSPDTPCGMDKPVTLGVTMYKAPIYEAFLNYFKELSNNCEIPKGLIDYYLRYKGLETFINTGHIDEAIDLYKKGFTKISDNSSFSRCGCHG